MNKKLLALLMGLALVLLLAACGGGGDEDAADTGTDTGGETATEDAGGDDAGTDAGGDDAATEDAGDGATASAGDAEKLYQQKCSSCHGGDLTGGVGPDLTAVGGKLSQEDIESVIANGQGAMPGGLLQGDEASTVAAWLAEKK